MTLAAGTTRHGNTSLMELKAPAISLGGYDCRGDGMEVVDPCAEAAWDEEALSHADGTVFHSSAWARVLARTYGHRAQYCRFSNGGKLIALVPLMELRSPLSGSRGVSLPFTDFCKPLMWAQCDGARLAENLAALARERKWKYFEIRGAGVAPAGATPSVAFYAHSVKLGATENLFTSLDPAVRRAVRKAEKSGIEATIAGSRAAMLDFYRLHVRTRRRHGLPPQPISFFVNIQEQVFEKGLGFISMVRAGGTAVAAAVFLCHGKKAIYKYGASDEAYQSARPNNLAMWHGMRHLAGNGYETLHMGRTSLDNDGLRQYKLGWGAEESRLEYFKYDTAAAAWTTSGDRVSGIHNVVFGRLPLSINRVLGRLIYPHLD